MAETIDATGLFHPYPVGALVWECTICKAAFCWNEKRSGWGNLEYHYAVFCSDHCAAQFTPDNHPKRVVVPIGKIDQDRVARRL